MTKRTHYTREFKLEAVRQLQTGQKPTSTLALELGVKRAVLYRWRDELARDGDQAFAGPGKRKATSSSDQELQAVRRELARVKEENEILKKAAAFFARELK